MNERCVYEKTYNNYGKIVLTLDKVLKSKKITPYRLSILTGINWGIIDKYTKGNMYRVDLDILSKICFALNCTLEDIIHYEYEQTDPRNYQEKSKNYSRI